MHGWDFQSSVFVRSKLQSMHEFLQHRVRPSRKPTTIDALQGPQKSHPCMTFSVTGFDQMVLGKCQKKNKKNYIRLYFGKIIFAYIPEKWA